MDIKRDLLFRSRTLCKIHTDDFTSPLTVKITTEVTKTRREEIDLETGRKMSWVETSEREVVDITGASSGRKPMGDRLNLPKVPTTASATTKDVNKLAPEIIDLTKSPAVDEDRLMPATISRRSSNRSRSRSPRMLNSNSGTIGRRLPLLR